MRAPVRAEGTLPSAASTSSSGAEMKVGRYEVTPVSSNASPARR